MYRLSNIHLLTWKRCFVTVRKDLVGSRSFSSKVEDDLKPNLNKVIKDAENIVGYGTTYKKLNWLMHDNMAVHLKKLVGTKHPVLNIARNFLLHEKETLQIWVFTILLLSKCGGLKSKTIPDQFNIDEVPQKQQNLSEAVELIKTGHLIQTGLLHMHHSEMKSQDGELCLTGNKIVLLIGNFLLARAYKLIADLRCSHAIELINSAIRDLTESEFVGERNVQNFAIPSKPADGEFDLNFEDSKLVNIQDPNRKSKPLDISNCISNPIREWTMRNTLGGASLLGNGCESALYMAGHDKNINDQGYLFGCHIALAWQASIDISTTIQPIYKTFSLVSAPVLFAINHDSSIHDLVKEGLSDLDSVDFDRLRKIIKKGPALENTNILLNKHCDAAYKCLDHFPSSEAKNVLKNIIDGIPQ